VTTHPRIRLYWSGVLLGLVVAPSAASISNAQEPIPLPTPSAAEAKPAPGVALPTQQDLARWSKPMSDIKVWTPAPQGLVPADGAATLFAETPHSTSNQRSWASAGLQWAPSELAYCPLYFDDVPLERYGQTAWAPLQPALSGARFFATGVLLPYKVIVDRPGDCIWDYGYYRPGSPTPCIRQRLTD
jgi:hypothetical protein